MKVYANALSEEASKKKQYYCVDLFKFICALMVVAIHIAPLSSYSTLINYGIQNYLARVAVPFFFVASGYFLFRKTSYENFDKTIPLAYAKRIFRLYVIWTVIYFPRVLRNSILRDEKGIVHGFLCWIRNCIFTTHNYGI
jgi:serine/alanine racemase